MVPKSNGGTIRFQNGRWSRGSVGSRLFRGLAEGGLGNPFADVNRALGQLATYLKKHGSEELTAGLEARPILVFTNPGTSLEISPNPPIPIVQTKGLRPIFRRAKATLTPEKVEELKQVLSREVTVG